MKSILGLLLLSGCAMTPEEIKAGAERADNCRIQMCVSSLPLGDIMGRQACIDSCNRITCPNRIDIFALGETYDSQCTRAH